EVLETLCTLAFTAWRHARALGRTRESQEWLERFDRLFAQPSIARECLEYFLATPALERSADLNDAFLLKSDELFFVCSILRKRCNASPAVLADEVRALHDWVDQRFWPCNFVDEREYFLAQMEHVAASCARWLGDREACLSWVRAAEGRYDRTVEPESGRAELMMLRLAVLYERHDLVEALSGIPELQARLRALGMMRALAKCEILLSAVLKDLGRVSESTVILEAALKTEVLTQVPDLRAFALEQLADCHGLSGRFEECAACLRSAAALLEGSLGTTAGGYGKIILGEALVVRGDLEGAVAAYRTGREDFEGLGMMGWSAYSRVLTAEVLLALRREGEAQQEILLAMPAIERHQMVPEGLAAVALLRESIRRRRTDRNALRELREHLRGKR
ncbi:MAG: hypothetical protein ACRD3M_12475, partial [Thermoanaerobaculia bacterium]